MKHIPSGVSWRHRFAAAVALVAFTSIVVGTFARSSFAWLASRQASGETPYEASHRVLVLSTLAGAALLVAWLWRSESSRYVKILGAITAGLVILEAIARGGISAVRLTPAAAAAHAVLASAVFSLLLCLALFTRTDWRWEEARLADVAAPSLRHLLSVTTAIIFVESILGSGLSAGIIRTPLHVWTGLVATVSALWVLEIALNKFSQVPSIKIPCILLAEAVVLQLFLGLVVHSMELNARASFAPQPGLPVMNATHAAAGALALAASLFATLQAFKHLAPAAALRAATPSAALQTQPQTAGNTDPPLRIE